jgi:PAS domain S-box-containing protein
MFDEDGTFKGYHGIGRNITERRRINEELRARQDMVELAQRAAHAAAFEWHVADPGSGSPARWSPDFEALCGLAPGSYDGTFASWRKLVFPEDLTLVDAAIRSASRTGDVAVEYRVAPAEGELRWLQMKGRVAFDEQGEPVRMVGFMLDITERHHAEDELRRLEGQLRQAQRMEAMGTLAGGIAHDFNNILGAILGYGEMSLRDAQKGGRLRRDLERIMTAAERGRALVEQILTFSRSSVIERVPVHIERVVREALDTLAAQLPSAVEVVPTLRSGNASVLGDPTQIHQVLMNLATNAFQAMPAGGKLRVLLESACLAGPRTLSTGTIKAGDYVVLEVADEGTGIPPEIVERIFDPFFTTKEVGIGTGLGLSLVHSIVTELGGAVHVASRPQGGSTFTVYLPRCADVAESGEHEVPDIPRGNGERVMVVDDEEPLMSIATETLEELGYRPTGYASSQAALQAFRAEPRSCDAVITDERMPGITGTALIREMRALRPFMPILLMSGFVGEAMAAAAREAGADEVLKKPLSRRDLAANLARVLQRTRADTH